MICENEHLDLFCQNQCPKSFLVYCFSISIIEIETISFFSNQTLNVVLLFEIEEGMEDIVPNCFNLFIVLFQSCFSSLHIANIYKIIYAELYCRNTNFGWISNCYFFSKYILTYRTKCLSIMQEREKQNISEISINPSYMMHGQGHY